MSDCTNCKRPSVDHPVRALDRFQVPLCMDCENLARIISEFKLLDMHLERLNRPWWKKILG
jgi:hypothetical protein